MKHFFVVLLLLLSFSALAQIPEQQPTSPTPAVPLPSAPPPLQLPPRTEPVKVLPTWAYFLGIGGWNTGLLALKHFGPKVPAWAVPLVNVGLTLGGLYLGVGMDPVSAVMNTALVSGGATVVHDVVKNAVKGDKLQDSSVVVVAGQAATKYN